MLQLVSVLALFALQLSWGKEFLNADPAELVRYESLQHRRSIFENFKQKLLFTVPGYSGRESPDDNEPPFVPSLECGDEFLNLTKGTFGTITSPNYPRRYYPDLQCEWILEGTPGTIIEVTFFDIYTQPWLFSFFDYIKVSLDGEWRQFHRFAGDVNYKTPYTLVSQGNRLGVRFITSKWLNFRGFSMFYVVRKQGKADISPQTNEFGSVLNNNIVAVCNRRPDLPSRPNDKFTDDKKESVKIINGEVTVPHKYPFTVALLINGQYFCSGTLIDDVNVITAAHCVEDAERIVFIFGLHNMTNPAERYYARQIRLLEFPQTVNHIHIHPHYDPDSGVNDIAIVRAPQKVRFTGYVQPIYLPSVYSASNSFYAKDLKTVGWGQYDAASEGISTVLREGKSRVISNGDCREEFRGAITGNNICTMTPYEIPEESNRTVSSLQFRRYFRSSNVSKDEGPEETTENPDESAVEPGRPEYISPCLGDAGGPLFSEFKETPDSSKDQDRQECVDAKPNGSGDEDEVKTLPACDKPKREARKWYVLVGVVTFGSRVCGEETPVVYTRVSAYLEWIAYVTGRHG